MKKFLTIIILLAAIFFLFLWGKDSGEIENKSDTSSETPFRPDPSSAAFTFDDGLITLSKGRSVTSAGDETTLLEEKAYGDINADGKEDVVVLLARSGGGSGVFIHVAAYVSGLVNYKGTNTVFLGDRVAPGSISIRNGVITVSYLDRDPEEALAAEPTIRTTKELIYSNGELVVR